MAVDSVWGKPAPSAWADDVDEQEHAGTLAAPTPLALKEEAFPSLAVAAKEVPKKKTKAKPLPLGAFLSGPAANRAAQDDKAILLSLPKGSSGAPRDESAALGGAFRDYGGDRGGGGFRAGGGSRYGDREGEEGARRGPEPSRADEADDWGANRKFQPTDSGGSRGFGGGFRDRDREGGGGGAGGGGGFGDRPPRRDAAPSAADEVDDWGASRKFQPSAEGPRGAGGAGAGAGGGFRDRDGAARPPRERQDEPSRADTEDWGSRRAPPPAPADDRAGPSGRRPGFGFSGGSAADSEDRWARGAGAPASSGGGDAPRERPRLNLAPRTKPVEEPAAAAAAAAPAAPGSPAAADGDGEQSAPRAAKPNPFGAARPRELVLKEKGIDYVKEELKLEHGEVIRDKTPEEEALEAEVEALRARLEGLKELQAGETDTLQEAEKELDEKEKGLYRLQAELDDRVRFAKNRPEERRPAAAAGAEGEGFERVAARRAGGAGGRGEGAAGGEKEGAPREQQQQQEHGGGPPARGGGSLRDRDARGPPAAAGERRAAW
ncbi:hypothetical protein Rsub_04486 [Raphidocelis subcapitata]|uniref:Uncharacterized protein n=1 Tax=Raphidocelis subcapitata TaxID=307507 RepID=A0A2V0NXS3_9CHLO|nr:hypothetical protein Rsub_04486 [Raphidocelis subcapitata]|eukprot:GBF92139.1 hypothetical protein Rsub_04486 [Raphidocelis subcapitata]